MDHIKRTLAPFLGIVPVLVLGGCEPVYFSAKLDAPSVCLNGFAFSFAPSGTSAVSEDMMSGDDLGVPDWNDLELDVMVMGVALAPTAGVSDLGFVEALSVRAAPADQASDVPEIMVVDMDGADLMSDGRLYAEPESPVDIAPHLRGGDVVLKIDVAGDLPAGAWESDLDLCVHAKARYRKPI